MTASAQRAAEPSMEEILASIRRIIADDKARPRLSSAKLVSVSENLPGEKLIGEAPRSESGRASTEIALAPIAEARPEVAAASSSREPDAPHADEHPVLEAELAQALEFQVSAPAVQEEPESAKPAGTLAPFGPATDQLRAFPPDGRLAPETESGQASEGPETQAEPDLPDDLVMRAHAVSAAIENEDPPRPEAPSARPPAPQPQAQVAPPVPEPVAEPGFASQPAPPTEVAAGEVRDTRSIDLSAGPSREPRKREPAAILSSESDMAITRAFGDLNRTVLSDNVRTLEDLVREMLRPLLKAWLDDNLPQIVERLVRTEIERVARGRPD
jgi:uncharacterized protein